MNTKVLEKRLRELSLYSDFYLRKELKVLAQYLRDDEQLNCILTGVHEANRKMIAVTDKRIMIIFAATLGGGDIKFIKREAVTDYWFKKKLFLSSVGFSTGNESYVFTNTQGRLKSYFEWAMSQPLP